MENKNYFGHGTPIKIEVAQYILSLLDKEYEKIKDKDSVELLNCKVAQTFLRPIIEDGIGCLNFFTKWGQPLSVPEIVNGQEEQHQVICYWEGKDKEKIYFSSGVLTDPLLLDQYNSLKNSN